MRMCTLTLLYSLFLSIPLLISADQAPDTCYPTRSCKDFQPIIDITEAGDINDTEIATTGHMSGLKPKSYDLTMHFQNTTHYTGSINISVNVVHGTNRFAVHMDNVTIAYDIKKTTIYHDCSHINLIHNCLQRVSYDAEKRLFLFWLKNELPSGVWLTLEFQGFTGLVYNPYDGIGSIALNRVNQDDVEAVHTNFLMKLASNVFPCFDHPSLKVKIRLCLEYPTGYKVASTATPSGDSTSVAPQHLRQCFENTPVIPVYVFTFAIMKNYEELQDYYETPQRVIFVPIPMRALFSILREKLRGALRSVKLITTTDLPFLRISVLLLYYGHNPLAALVGEPSAVGIGNVGLITLYAHESQDGQWREQRGGHFYRAIVHQWIGAGITVSHWGEICLQHGLAQYMEWVLWEQKESINISSTVANIPRHMLLEERPPMSEILANYPPENDLNCDYRAALIFYMVADVYHLSVMKDCIASLSQTFESSNANIDAWDTTLAECTNILRMTDYIRSWFTKVTPVILRIRYYDDAINLKQVLISGLDDPRPIPIRIHVGFPVTSTFSTFRTVTTKLWLPQKPNCVVVDPNNALLVIKLYGTGLYLDMLTELAIDYRLSLVSPDLEENYLNSFCNALLSDLLPLPSDNSFARWTSVFDKARRFTTKCDCCLAPRNISSKSYPKCPEEIGYRCDSRLVNLVRYNTTE